MHDDYDDDETELELDETDELVHKRSEFFSAQISPVTRKVCSYAQKIRVCLMHFC